MSLQYLLPLFLFACQSSWVVQDLDGDGKTFLDGDCWDGLEDPVPPEGAFDYGITADMIGVGNEDLPYDGIDQNCDGSDDFDPDGDGFVHKRFWSVIGKEDDGSPGDCWDVAVPEFEFGDADALLLLPAELSPARCSHSRPACPSPPCCPCPPPP